MVTASMRVTASMLGFGCRHTGIVPHTQCLELAEVVLRCGSHSSRFCSTAHHLGLLSNLLNPFKEASGGYHFPPAPGQPL